MSFFVSRSANAKQALVKRSHIDDHDFREVARLNQHLFHLELLWQSGNLQKVLSNVYFLFIFYLLALEHCITQFLIFCS